MEEIGAEDLTISIHAPARGATAKLDKIYLSFAAIITKIKWIFQNVDLMHNESFVFRTIFALFAAPTSRNFLCRQGRRTAITAELFLPVPVEYAPLFQFYAGKNFPNGKSEWSPFHGL